MKLTPKLIVAFVLIAGLFLATRFLDLQGVLRSLLKRVEELGPWGIAAFILIYVVACVLLLPGSILTLGAGVVFGVARGTVICSIAATLGATAAFLVGRYLARGWVADRVSKDGRFKAIDDAVAKEGWKIVGLTRLSPVIPFNVLNYAFGLTRVSLKDYVLASWIGMLPGTAMYVYLGSLIGNLGRLDQGNRTRTPAENALYLFGLIATVAVTIYVTRLGRRALNQHLASRSGT